VTNKILQTLIPLPGGVGAEGGALILIGFMFRIAITKVRDIIFDDISTPLGTISFETC
jgi:hypothetical protein